MGLFGKKSKNENVEKQAEQNSAELEALKAEEEGKLAERYNKVMPIVKKYLDSIGFELPTEESIFFMQIDDNTGKWKYGMSWDAKYTAAVENPDFISETCNTANEKYKYILQEKVLKRGSSGGILLASDGKALIGSPTPSGNFFWCTESGEGIDNSMTLPINNVLAVGNIKNQFLCGLHISDFECTDKDDICYINDKNQNFQYTNSAAKKDFYFGDSFPKSTKRLFILPNDEYEKKNTVVLGGSFSKYSDLRLVFCGFDKIIHEKWFTTERYWSIFEKDTHGTFICPSADCDILNEKYLTGRSGNFAERNWELKVGTTIQNAVSPEEAAKQESENIRAALEANAMAEVNAKLSEKKEELSKLEAALAAKKAEVASLGMDAQGIVQKAKLNKEIKELEPQIENLKAEIEKLSK